MLTFIADEANTDFFADEENTEKPMLITDEGNFIIAVAKLILLLQIFCCRWS